MKIIEFLKMDKVTRAGMVVDKGIYVDGFSDGEHCVQVYYFNSYFVEIVINKRNEITEATPFISGYRKEKYPILAIHN